MRVSERRRDGRATSRNAFFAFNKKFHPATATASPLLITGLREKPSRAPPLPSRHTPIADPEAPAKKVARKTELEPCRRFGLTRAPSMGDSRKSTDEKPSPPGSHRRAILAALRRLDLRETWWALLDAWEARRALRWTALGLLAAALLGSIFWFWFHPWWTQRNAVVMARQWIEAGKTDFAADTVKRALARHPDNPELWSLAASLARLNRQNDLELDYAGRAAQLSPGTPKYLLEWASAAILAGKHDIAKEALAQLAPADLARSALAHRMLGEMQRRQSDLSGARKHFETALQIDGPTPAGEIPLALCLLAGQPAPADHARGVDLLKRWTGDPEWGATALRMLLDDALAHDDLAAIPALAVALRAHPQCTFGDIPVCLRALALADGEKFGQELAALQQIHRATPEAAAQLAGWLNQIGKSADALAWLGTLPADQLQRPPLVQARAEALRATSSWGELDACASTGDWGADLDFLRWTYGLVAARQLKDDKKAGALWQTLHDHALRNSAHALFAGSALYGWGFADEAVQLWWRAAGQSTGGSYEALGTLARHYQVARDAEGQYKVFARLRSLRPQDDAIANNFVFFAVLTGNRELNAENTARDLVRRHPGDPTYAATHAYVLFANGRADEALRVIEPHAARHPASPGVQFAYGLALAGTGNKEKAEPILRALPPETLTLREVELIESLLRR